MAPGEHGASGQPTPALQADACEALIGALYLDGGFEAARRFVTPAMATALVRPWQTPPRDPKMALQEWAQARGLDRPAYRVVEIEGPAHAHAASPSRSSLADQPSLRGHGTTKRAAERAAARRCSCGWARPSDD